MDARKYFALNQVNDVVLANWQPVEVRAEAIMLHKVPSMASASAATSVRAINSSSLTGGTPFLTLEIHLRT